MRQSNHISTEHLDLLIKANAAEYIFKQSFYEVKKKILDEHAEKVGLDLQQLIRRCRTCDGHGNYTIYGELSGDILDVRSCWNCNGTGKLGFHYWVLQRHLLNDHLFHTPLHSIDPEGADLDRFTKTIQGTIKHEPVDERVGLFAYFELAAYYAPEQLKQVCLMAASRNKSKWKKNRLPMHDLNQFMSTWYGIPESVATKIHWQL